MAQGDFTLFDELTVILGEGDSNGQHIDFETDTFKVSLVLDSGADPTAADTLPAYSGGTTNWNAGTEESTSVGNYTVGGEAITTPTWVESAGSATFDGVDVTWAQHASNPSSARWGIMYDDTTTIKHAIGFIDLGSDFDMTTGPLTITFAGTGILVMAIQASV